MDQQPNYYAIITADVRYDNRLTDSEKLLYAEITALSNKYGYCIASNGYFAKLYNVTKVTISRRISKLTKNNYLHIETIKKGEQIVQRKLYPLTQNIRGINTNDNTPINNFDNTPINNFDNTPINTNVKDNNTSINNTSINTINNNSSCSGINNIDNTNIKSANNKQSEKQQQPQPKQPNVFDFYQENGFGMLTPNTVQKLDDWITDFKGNEEIIIEALKEADENNVRKWSYVNSILKNWHSKNVKTLNDINALKNERQATSYKQDKKLNNEIDLMERKKHDASLWD